MKIGDKVTELVSVGTIVGKDLSDNWIVEWSYEGYDKTPSEIRFQDPDMPLFLVISETEYIFENKNTTLSIFLDAAASVDQWWHNRQGKISKSRVFANFCDVLSDYSDFMGLANFVPAKNIYLEDLLNASDDIDDWWHAQEGKVSKNLIFEKFCRTLNDYYEDKGFTYESSL